MLKQSECCPERFPKFYFVFSWMMFNELSFNENYGTTFHEVYETPLEDS